MLLRNSCWIWVSGNCDYEKWSLLGYKVTELVLGRFGGLYFVTVLFQRAGKTVIKRVHVLQRTKFVVYWVNLLIVSILYFFSRNNKINILLYNLLSTTSLFSNIHFKIYTILNTLQALRIYLLRSEIRILSSLNLIWRRYTDTIA
jgi:hypothetical protein